MQYRNSQGQVRLETNTTATLSQRRNHPTKQQESQLATENYQEETIQQNINTIPEYDLKKIDNLIASLEKLSVSHQEPELPKSPTLKTAQLNLKTAMNGEQQQIFQGQAKQLVNTAKNGITNSMIIFKLQLFTDASFNNLSNRGSQAGHIIFSTDDKSNTCPLYWNSSKIKRIARSTIVSFRRM